ncbi:VOC family protein [Vibrio gangliei]|uniref:VOC family protein n=1 Tax=Vibrio gangliei TaxID=2077090 RepID=UPI000D012AA3|nr:VOC family protein [Vibrio gangliei]
MSTNDFESLSPAQLRIQLPQFWQKIEQLSELLGLELDNLTADHIAMRINDWALTEQVHQAWLEQGTQLSNAMINGRPIIVLQLEQALQVAGQEIDCLELPYPSDNTYPQQGWEHVEFVVASPAQTVEDFTQDVRQAFPKLDSQWDQLAELGVKVKLSSPKGEGERLANPTVAFKKEGVCIKLHPHTLKAVIASEQE